MKFLFYLSLITILYTYAGYPLAIAALARLRPRTWTKSPWPRLDPNPSASSWPSTTAPA